MSTARTLRTIPGYLWRIPLCALAYVVAPFVMEYYKQGQFALAVPNPAVILATQFARSALFLLGALPVLILWSGSRRHLVLALAVLLVRNDETNADELFARYLLCMAQTPIAN